MNDSVNDPAFVLKERESPVGRIRKANETAIIRAAEEEFVRNGFKGTTVQQIADRAGLPKANVHYYFKNKLELYAAVLSDILELWNQAFNDIRGEDDPARAISAYIRAKVMYSKTNPLVSRLFAQEIIQGAPHLGAYFKQDHRDWLQQKAKVIEYWIEQGKMDPVDPYHLIFLIWASTQHYADFGAQITSVMGEDYLNDEGYERIARSLTQMVLKACGLKVPE